MKASFTSTSYTPDNLIAGDFPLKSRSMTLLSGQNLARGAVLGVVTASGKVKLSAAGASDGSEVAKFVLAEDCNASAADTACIVYETGELLGSALTLGALHTIASVRESLRDGGILVR